MFRIAKLVCWTKSNFGMRNESACGAMQNAECKMQNECRIQNAECRIIWFVRILRLVR